MAKRGVPGYIVSMLKRGYSPDIIRNKLLESGYNIEDIDKAFSSAYGKGENKFIPIIILMMVIISLSAIGYIYFYYFYPQKNSSAFSFSIKADSSDAERGDFVVFSKETELISDDNVLLKYELISKDDKSVIAKEEEYGSLAELFSRKSKLEVPIDAKSGAYQIKATLEYKTSKKTALAEVNIDGSGKSRSNDGGEPDLSAETTNLVPSTTIARISTTTSTVAIQEEEDNENLEDIDVDSLDSYEALFKIKELAKSNSETAASKCSDFEIDIFRYDCYSNIAEVTGDYSFCDKIKDERLKDNCIIIAAKSSKDDSVCEKASSSEKKDSCYRFFVFGLRDYSVCFKINDEMMRTTCENLRDV